MKRYTLITFLLNLTTCLYSQIPTLRNFTNVDYSGGTQNWAIDISDDNRMLFANNNGLLTFDGDQWNVYQIQGYTNVRSILCDKKKNIIYASGTDEFGYFKRNTKNYQLEYHSMTQLLPKKGMQFGEIWNILRIGNEIAFQGKNHIFILHENGKITPHEFSYSIDDMSAVGNKLYISSKEKIFVYQNGKLSVSPVSDVLYGKNIAAVLQYGKNTLFVTTTDGIYIYDGKETRPFILDITPTIISSQVFCADIQNDKLALGTVRGGVIVKDLKTGRNEYANIFTGLQNNTILSLYFDELDNLWLGLDNGIAFVDLSTPYRKLYGMANNLGTGYASLKYNDILYLGTNQGLFSYKLPLSVTSPTPSQASSVKGLNGQVWSCKKIGDKVLVGGNDGGFIINGNTATRIPELEGTWGFIELKGHPETALGCDNRGFFTFNLNTNSVSHISGTNIVTGLFMQDEDGSIWACHWRSGIYHFKLNSDLTKATLLQHFDKSNGLPMNNDNLICKINGKVYTSSVDGFRIYDPKTGKLIKDKKLDNLFDTYGLSLRVEETPTGDLWAYKPGYLAIAHKQKDGIYKTKRLTYLNLIKHLQMGIGHIGFLDDTHTLLNYDNGFIIVDNKFDVNKNEGNNLLIKSIYSTNDNDSLIYAARSGQIKKEIKIPHSLNSLRIEFVMPEFRDDNGVEYSCYLENYDNRWTDLQGGTSKEYTKLSKGTYIFHVKAHNLVDDSERDAIIKIHILPAWYETWWAYIIYILAIWLLIHFAVRHLKKNAEKELCRVRTENERQLRERQLQFKIDEEKKDKEIIRLRNDQLEIEIKHKSSELADNAINLVRKNDMLQAIDSEMEELSKSVKANDAKASVTKKISDIRRNIHTHMVDDNNWDKFEENFNLIYDNFTQKLMKNFTDLKKTDLKLCVYLRMGLSSKEMASLLNTSVRSIETARYRLRKKLDIGSGENLLSFIQTIDKMDN